MPPKRSTSQDELDEEPTEPTMPLCTCHVDFTRIQHKIDNLPTVEKLLQEEDPNTYTAEQLQEAACFVRDLLQTAPVTEQDVERAQRKLMKRHRKVFKKSLLLTAYKHILEEGAPAADIGAAAVGQPSKRQLRREERQGRQQHQQPHQQSQMRQETVEVHPANNQSEDNDEEDAKMAVHAEPAVKDMEDLVSPTVSAVKTADTRLRMKRCPALESYLVFKAPRSQSGVLVVTVFTSPYPDGQRFSCQWNCYYCPNEPDQPRSYLLNEPGVRRANRLAFDACGQFTERVKSLVSIGHPADKVELLVLGGTWESYPIEYRTRFMRDLFYAANTMFDDNGDDGETSMPNGESEEAKEEGKRMVNSSGIQSHQHYLQHSSKQRRRPPLDLLQEQLINEHATCKIIGVTLETRPDTINAAMLKELRRFGCTRVQLGVQHTDDAVLTKVNRQATREDTMQAIKLLKDSCFKVDIHLMPDLPGATPDVDKAMFDDVLQSPYLQADQWKIYPCQTTPFTVIEEWYKKGLYTPYGLENLIDVLLYAKTRVHPWIRLNRVVRDIPVDYVLAGLEIANLRQLLAIKLKEQGQCCHCIRCREVRGDKDVAAKLKTAELKERRYEASEGTETFLSFETPDEATIFGFLRLRTDMRQVECPFPELQGCALIRELHVYGHLVPAQAEGNSSANASREKCGKGEMAQHTGLGTRLLARAEALSIEAGYTHIAVISGVGVRGYYRRRGYRLFAAHCGGYMIKDLTAPSSPLETGKLKDRLHDDGTEVTSCADARLPSARENKYMAYLQGVQFGPLADSRDTSADRATRGRRWISWPLWRSRLQALWRGVVSRASRKRPREDDPNDA